jgi:hypothetical protein
MELGLVEEVLTLIHVSTGEELEFSGDYLPQFDELPSVRARRHNYKYMMAYGLHAAYQWLPSPFILDVMLRPTLFGHQMLLSRVNELEDDGKIMMLSSVFILFVHDRTNYDDGKMAQLC